MRKKNFPRKLHSILSITLSLVMLIGACFAVPATTAMAEGETSTIIFDFDNNNAGMKVGDNTVENLRVSSGAFGLNLEKPAAAQGNILSINGSKTACNHGDNRDLLFNDGSNFIPLAAGTYDISYDYFVENRDVTETANCQYCQNFFAGTKYQHIKFVTLKKSGFSWSSHENTRGVLSDGLFAASVVSETIKNASGSGTVTITVTDQMVADGENYLGLRISSLSYAVWLDNIVLEKVLPPDTAYAEDHDVFTTYGDYTSDVGSKDTMNANNTQISGNVFNYRNLLFSNAWVEDNSVLAVALYSGARHMRLNDTAQGLALRAGKTYSLTFKWLNPNPEKDGVVGNKSVNNADSTGYDNGAKISLVANAGAFNGTGYSTLVTLLNVNDFSSAEGNTGEFVTKTVTFTTPDGGDITDIAISTISVESVAVNSDNLNEHWIFLDDIQFIDISDSIVEVSFNTDGGTDIAPVQGLIGETITVVDPVKFGYKFTGWFEDADCTVPSDMKFSKDVTVLYAGWTEAEMPIDVTGYDMFKNDSGLKLEDTAGTIMENNSVIYKKADGSERTAFRFVSSYDYYTDGTNQYLDADKTIKIVKRGMLFGKVEGENYTHLSSSEKDATAEAWSDNGSTIEYTFKVFNISYANKDVEYYVTPYLIVDVGGKELTITGDTASNSIQGIYNNSTAAQNNYTWYTQQ